MKQDKPNDTRTLNCQNARFEIGKSERGPKVSGRNNLVSLVVDYFSVSPADGYIPWRPPAAAAAAAQAHTCRETQR